MYKMIDQLMKVEKWDDQLIAADLLNSVKSGIRNYAWAITETVSPEVRECLTRQLNEAIHYYGDVSNYLISKGYYAAFDLNQQLEMDFKNAGEVLKSKTGEYHRD